MGSANVHGKDKDREGTVVANSKIRASRRHALKLLGAGGLAFAAPAIIGRSPGVTPRGTWTADGARQGCRQAAARQERQYGVKIW